MKRILLLTLTLFVFGFSKTYSQARIENRNNFYEAESWILFESYKDALPIYTQLLKSYPTNNNFKYRIGQCYLNISGEKDKAISFLEDAVKNINPEYKEGNFKEKGAPFDALYYLANAYRINNQLDKALETYEKFKKNLDSKVYDTAVVELQIQSCLNAKELMSRPLYVKMENLGELINESNAEFNPVVSDNNDVLVYSKSEAFYDAILYSTKQDGKWSGPLNMNEILQVDRDYFPTSISKDGNTLYLYSSLDYDGRIYTSTFANGRWNPIVKLNDNINTKFWESHATVSHDDRKLYFTSNRKGSIGGLDIYVSKRDTSGDWGTPLNLGPVINTIYNEE
ncbi:MAG TPA: tetratricopeptide repeat protein, partial [Bacteroidales bacterium]|nr:tetratricopeptide repeat protein [Bacteroidales bacterium]